MSDIAARIARVKETAARAQQMRADANSAIGFAKQQLEQIDAELTRIGINPENAEQELAALEAQLDTTVTELETQLAAEADALGKVLNLARQAQIIR